MDARERGAGTLGTDLAAEGRAAWDGFARFCRAELDIAPATVIGAYFAPITARLERQREALDAAEPDPAMVDEYARGLTEGWRRIVGRQPAARRQAPPPRRYRPTAHLRATT